MTVTTSYPGIYIQELPSLAHSIQPAPTSIAVFVGYTHPFRTKKFLAAVPLFSFADYQSNFGGFFSSPWQPDYVGQAVFQFFSNGGPMCYVVGLQAQKYYDFTQSPPGQGDVAPASIEVTCVDGDLTFTALQPVGIPAVAPATTGIGVGLQVTLSNFQASAPTVPPTPAAPLDTADIVISYGSTVETYRKVVITKIRSVLQNSSLVSVTAPSPAPTAYVASATPSSANYSLGYTAPDVAPEAGWTVINPGDFGQVFQNNQSLDKVPIFNLLATPGISDPAVASEAVAFCEGKRAFYIADTPSPQVSGWDANSLVDDLAGGTALSPSPAVSINAAVYYPWLATTDPVTQQPALAPPSGFVAGIYGKVDASQGYGKSPAGIETALNGTTGVDPDGLMTDPQQGVLNQNARQLPAAVPRRRHCRIRRAHDGRGRRQHRAAAVEVRGRAADGALHRADACTPA